MFTESFLDSLSDNPLEAAHEMCIEFQNIHREIPNDTEEENYDSYVQGYAAIEALIETFALPFDLPDLGDNKQSNIDTIAEFVHQVYSKLDRQMANLSLSLARDKFRARFGISLAYEFTSGDLERIQELINELRDLIATSEVFDAKHKDRVLKRLEALQREVHKKMSSLDKFWGLIGDAGVALGKFGRDAKPFVDRIREITQIVWRTQARAEELPSGTPLPLLTEGETSRD